MRDKIRALLRRYPGNTTLVTSRIVGYEKEIRYDGLGFSHHQVAHLTLPNIEAFIHNWYRARIGNERERTFYAGDLIRILHDQDSRAIRDLVENPLLLTIICLVHRIDAVLPDERVVLYQKCTETLLNTWHAWKFKIEHQKSRNKVERRNRARLEAIAHWMHGTVGEQEKGKRAVVPYRDLTTGRRATHRPDNGSSGPRCFCRPWRPDSGNPCRTDAAESERSGSPTTSFHW